MSYIKSFSGQYDFLSNFSQHPVWLEGEFYPTVENAYQAAKTLDYEYRRVFQDVTPGQAKRLGQKMPLRPNWNVWYRHSTMATLLRSKFSTSELRDRLVDTGPSLLIEGNQWHDNTWGVCYCGRCKNGLNLLGVELMRLRNCL